MAQRIIPGPVAGDDDDVVVALETARVSEERRDLASAIRWLQRAIEAAQRQGRSERVKVLGRCVVKLGGDEPQFEPAEPEPHVRGEITDDDFSEKTIVESFEIRGKQGAEPAASPGAPSSSGGVAAKNGPPYHLSRRVAARKTSNGRFEVRPLSEGEPLESGEEEALLVPLSLHTRF